MNVPRVSNTASASEQLPSSKPSSDDPLTVAAICLIAAVLTNILHEGVGHGLIALATGAQSGLLTTVAWSSDFESRLVEAGGTFVNLAAGVMLWTVLRGMKRASVSLRYFLLISCAYNLFTGTGYFFFSGVTNFGDWAAVISSMQPHWMWRLLLVCAGVVSYLLAVRAIGVGLVRYVAVPLADRRRLFRLMLIPYVAAILLVGVAGLLNPISPLLVLQLHYLPLLERTAACFGCGTTSRVGRSQGEPRMKFSGTTSGSDSRPLRQSSS